ncbi:MAG: hypothetical protein IJ419_01990 [Agathobacter sp.]|nr:hypothetical protein [Agathobacter sp.]
MKKIVAFLLIAALSLGCVACGRGDNKDTQNQQGTDNHVDNEDNKNTEPETNAKLEIKDANEILTKVWNTYKEDEKFAAVGGHYESYTDGAPAKYDITKTEDLEAVFCIPAESIALVDDVASLQHGMNVNNFTAAAYHLKNSADMQVLIDDITNMTLNNQWLCGFPERLIIITVGDEYVVTAYGNGEIVDNFKSKLLGLYDGAPQLVVSEDL